VQCEENPAGEHHGASYMLVRLGLAVTCSVAAITVRRQFTHRDGRLGNEGFVCFLSCSRVKVLCGVRRNLR
jgi:hypothetical protein